ncbi:unnamed protein product [Effrenium voratum]|nr:unnamed protein product [Effrenium voratum]
MAHRASCGRAPCGLSQSTRRAGGLHGTRAMRTPWRRRRRQSAAATRDRWQALLDGQDPAGRLATAVDCALAANQAFYEAFNGKDLEKMSSLWGCNVNQWGPLLFFQNQDESFKMMCTCTHPDSSRLEGRNDILTSFNRIFLSPTLPTITISQEEVLVTSEDMAVVVCKEETSNGGLHEATNTFARSSSGSWFIIGHQAGPVMK